MSSSIQVLIYVSIWGADPVILITDDAKIVASPKEIYCIALNAELLLKYLLPQVTQSLGDGLIVLGVCKDFNTVQRKKI